MYWATEARPVPLTELGWINTSYLASGASRCDPMLVWGTTVETEALDEFIAPLINSHRWPFAPNPISEDQLNSATTWGTSSLPIWVGMNESTARRVLLGKRHY